MIKKVKVEEENILCDVCGEHGSHNANFDIDLCYNHEKLIDILNIVEKMETENATDILNSIVDEITQENKEKLLSKLVEKLKTTKVEKWEPKPFTAKIFEAHDGKTKTY